MMNFAMNYPIYISSDSEDEVVPDSIRLQDGTITNDASLIYHAALQDLNQPKTEKDLPPGVLSVPLMRHQKIALEWMSQKEISSNSCLGGILADYQGLGKTISTIALILLQKLESQSNPKKPSSRRSGGTLVVCPASVVKQWARELDDKVSVQHKLSVLQYLGPNRTNDPVELAKYDVVLTTYALVSNDFPDQNHHLNSNDGKSEVKSGAKTRRRLPGAVARVKWLRVVLDEAHTIEDHETQVARACSSLKAKMRWCLSGTLIGNNIEDLFSYFKFLRYHPYSEFHSFRQRTAPITRNHLRGYKMLKAILGAILLRRTKGTLLDGQRIIHLPPKVVNMTKVDFSPEERIFYSALEGSVQSEFKAFVASGTVCENYGYILVMLSRLRLACDHPQLVKTFKESQHVNDDDKRLQLVRESDFMSTKIKAMMDTLESLAKQDSPDSLPIKTLVSTQWSGMLELLEHNFVKNGIGFRRLDSSMSLLAREIAVEEFNNDPNVRVMLMSLRVGKLGFKMVPVSQVIILDLWWSPTAQDQAIDLVHRIGQNRPFTVTRITTINTVEDRILALQEKKRKVVGSVLGEDPGELCPIQLTIEDLEYLFCGV